MTPALRFWPLALAATLGWVPQPGSAAETQQLIHLLESRQCTACRLQDADLTQADLRDASLRSAQLQRANLSGARLDGADLRNSNLSFTILVGASLRGADLRGSIFNGTDLRHADLSGAQLDPGSLTRAHWQQAEGIHPQQHSYAELHNAGVTAAQQGRHPDAERFFGEAIRRLPEAAISWVARGISRVEQGKNQEAKQDWLHASSIYLAMGSVDESKTLRQAAERITAPEIKTKGGNGIGGGALSALQMLAPIAIKALAFF